MKAFAVRYPFLFGILVTLAAVSSQMWPMWIPRLPQGAHIFFARAAAIALAIILLTWLKWWREAGFVSFRSWKILLPYLPLTLLVLVGYISIFAVSGITGIKVNDPSLIVLGAASFLAGGFVEEALFRGVVLRAFLPRNLLKAAAFSALIFASAHLPNLLVGQNLGATAMQFFYSFLVGFTFVAPLAYTRNIWPLVILHGLMNFSTFLATGNITAISTQSPTIEQVISEIVIFGLMSAYGFWLLRRPDLRISQRSLT